MTTSGTTSFNPSLGEITLHAFQLAGVRPTSISQEHMTSARMASNLMLSRWANMGVNLWKVSNPPVTVNLVTDQSTYSVDPSTVMVLDAYVSTDNGDGTTTDRIILPISRTEYASYPNKTQQGFTTIYWFDRLLSPTITLWPVPNVDSGPSTLTYYSVTQIQDANFTSGQTVDIPYRWMEAFTDGLAFRLAKIWSPQLAVTLKQQADESYGIAAQQDTEYVNMYISPQVAGYWRP
jgi:hypothetical protein